MRYGVCIFPTEYAMPPAALGPALEARGFESIWVPEHTHIPCSRATPWPGGAELPKPYYDIYAPLVTLAAIASVTTTLRLATGVLLVPQHDPLVLAKEVATLDRLSGGRVLLGVGGGWNREEYANHTAVPFARRWRLMRERIEAMRLLWTEERAAYRGEFVRFDEAFSWPKPVQRPHPPIHVGGTAPWAIRRALRYGDGWLPLAGRGGADPLEDIATFRRLAREAGRDPDRMEVSLYAAPPDADRLARLRDAGYARAIFLVPSAGADVLVPRLDDLAALARRVG